MNNLCVYIQIKIMSSIHILLSKDTCFMNYGMFVDSQIMEFNSNIKKLVMLVEVTNVADSNREAEDAHQATLNITIPHTLKYSGLRTPVRPQEDAGSLQFYTSSLWSKNISFHQIFTLASLQIYFTFLCSTQKKIF